MVADCVKTKSPIVEEETADDALQEIVGKTHLAMHSRCEMALRIRVV